MEDDRAVDEGQTAFGALLIVAREFTAHLTAQAYYRHAYATKATSTTDCP